MQKVESQLLFHSQEMETKGSTDFTYLSKKELVLEKVESDGTVFQSFIQFG